MESVFNKFDDEEADEQPRKRKLVPLDYGDDDKSLGLDGAEISGAKGSINTEEKRKHIKSLIEKIPTARPELFSYPLDWTMVDSVKSGSLICNHFIYIYCLSAQSVVILQKRVSQLHLHFLIVLSVDPDGSPHSTVDQ